MPDSSLEKVEREGVLEKNVRALEEPFAKGLLQADVVIGFKGVMVMGKRLGQVLGELKREAVSRRSMGRRCLRWRSEIIGSLIMTSRLFARCARPQKKGGITGGDNGAVDGGDSGAMVEKAKAHDEKVRRVEEIVREVENPS